MTKILGLCKLIAVLLLLVGMLAYSYLLIQAFFRGDGSLRAEMLKDPKGSLGIPFAAVAAFGIVAMLEFGASDKSLKFKAFSLAFEGPSAPVTLWMVCFGAFVAAIKALA